MVQKFGSMAALAASFLVVAGAQAQQEALAPNPAIALSPALVIMHKPYPMSSSDMSEFRGQYLLDNGSTFTVVQHNRPLYSSLTDHAQEALVARSANTFSTKTGSTEVQFVQSPNGSVSGVVLKQIVRKQTPHQVARFQYRHECAPAQEPARSGAPGSPRLCDEPSPERNQGVRL